jgi:hypothetical protein
MATSGGGGDAFEASGSLQPAPSSKGVWLPSLASPKLHPNNGAQFLLCASASDPERVLCSLIRL